jgi:5-methyltetrahydrofolate--homocysteine methyltransferase
VGQSGGDRLLAPTGRFALDIDGVPRTARAQALLDALSERVVIADGAMGTMLQRHDLQIDTDFQGLEGCNEILNVTRPDVVGAIHDAYFAVGVDAVETNTFGANWSNLSDYGIDDRITELAPPARGSRASAPRRPRRSTDGCAGCSGRWGPGRSCRASATPPTPI